MEWLPLISLNYQCSISAEIRLSLCSFVRLVHACLRSIDEDRKPNKMKQEGKESKARRDVSCLEKEEELFGFHGLLGSDVLFFSPTVTW